jgi:hypothetical protein
MIRLGNSSILYGKVNYIDDLILEFFRIMKAT